MRVYKNFNPQSAKTLQQRFDEKVNKDGPIPAINPALGPCEEWIGSCSVYGYGILNIGDKDANGKYKGKLVGAHRIAWFLEYGEWPKKGCALHHCDNPKCVRISHLFNGNRPINNEDRKEKDGYKTQPKGEQTYNHIFTEAQVQEILDTCVPGKGSPTSYTALGKKFGTTYHAVRLAHLGINWPHMRKSSVDSP